MDKIEERLHDSSKKCFDAYEAWSKDQKNVKAREELQEAVHELRKIASRLEIELAISERDEMAQRPIPIPPHRDSNRRPRGDDNIGNTIEPGDSQPPSHGHGGQSHGGGGGQRRTLRRNNNRDE